MDQLLSGVGFAFASPRRRLRLALLAVLAAGCSWTAPRSLEGLACDDGGNCASGYVCDQGTRTCVAESACVDGDLDGYCADSDCDDADDACGETADCLDGDGDGLRACGGDSDDANAHCGRDATDVDLDGWCAGIDCDDAIRGCNDLCVDGDTDGFCGANDCDDTNEHCAATGCVDVDQDDWCADFDCDDGIDTCTLACVDADIDGIFVCEGDCFDGDGRCSNDCSDVDTDNIEDCRDTCVDDDGDGVGTGMNDNASCAGGALVDENDANIRLCGDSDSDDCNDCDSGAFAPDDDGQDTDMDGACDAGDTCTDFDRDRIGDGQNSNTGCIIAAQDSDDGDNQVCVDSDGDGCDDCDSMVFNPAMDGTDGDGDGWCDTGDSVDNNDRLCADTDADNCDDCSSGRFDPAADGVDVDMDGVCSVLDCDDTLDACATGPECTTDADNDGTPLCADCNDTIPTCAGDCATNSDTDLTVDCIEQACGSNPQQADVCIVADGSVGSRLHEAVSRANTGVGFEYVLVTYAVSFDTNGGTSDRPPAQTLSGATCMSIRSVQPFTLLNLMSAFIAEAPGCTFDGLTFTGGQNVLDLRGADAIVRGCDISAWGGAAAIRIAGDGARVQDCYLHDSTVAQGGDNAGIVVSVGANGVRIIGNVIANNLTDGIQLRDGPTDVLIDHNTIALNGVRTASTNADAIEVSGGSDVDSLCMRNNLVALNAGVALRVVDGIVWNETSACTLPLGSTPSYGNLDFGNGGGCAGNCSAPAGTLWSFTADPLFDSAVAATELGRYCLGEPALIDAGADLGWDLNGAQPLLFNGSAPDIGGLEDGLAPCN